MKVRTHYIPRANYERYYHNQCGLGADLPMYGGVPMQRGHGLGNILRGVFKAAVPIVMPLLKRGAQKLGNVALNTGKNVVADIVRGDDVKSSLKRRGRESLGELFGVPIKKIKRNGRNRHTAINTSRDIFN